MIRMKREKSIKEVTDPKLVSVLEKKGWEKLDVEVKAVVKPLKPFVEETKDKVEVTPTVITASVENANEGE